MKPFIQKHIDVNLSIYIFFLEIIFISTNWWSNWQTYLPTDIKMIPFISIQFNSSFVDNKKSGNSIVQYSKMIGWMQLRARSILLPLMIPVHWIHHISPFIAFFMKQTTTRISLEPKSTDKTCCTYQVSNKSMQLARYFITPSISMISIHKLLKRTFIKISKCNEIIVMHWVNNQLLF